MRRTEEDFWHWDSFLKWQFSHLLQREHGLEAMRYVPVTRVSISHPSLALWTLPISSNEPLDAWSLFATITLAARGQKPIR